jgi:hypothetical protein
MKKIERNGWYNINSDIQILGIKRKVGITTEIIQQNHKEVLLKSFVVDYDDMMMVYEDFKKFGNPLDNIDELIRSKDISENKKDEIFPKLILSYIPKMKSFKVIERINKNQISDWYEFGIKIEFILLDKGIYCDKVGIMKYVEWEKTMKENHTGIYCKETNLN